MTKFKIIGKEWTCGDPTFYLDDYMTYEDGRWHFIICGNRSPFNSYQVGDYLEIDINRIKNCHSGSTINDTSVVRKYDSSAVASSSSGQMSLSREQAEVFADRLADRVEKSGGQYELDAYIQQGTEPHGTPYTRQGWVYRKKN